MLLDIYFANAPLVRVFSILFLQSPILPEDFANCVAYHCSIQTAARNVPVHLLSDLFRYLHFEEALLMPSQIVDTSTIYSRFYVGML